MTIYDWSLVIVQYFLKYRLVVSYK